MSWDRGKDEVHHLLAEGMLEAIRGSAADGSSLLDSSGRLLESAEREARENPEAAFVLAYDAARKSCAALLAQQGLRTRSSGHHVTTERVMRAQFGGPFDAFGVLRRRRIEVEYPQYPGDEVTLEEAREAIKGAQAMHTAASNLIEELGFFTIER
jgi:uncharacterized protein (UPF0332 family)